MPRSDDCQSRIVDARYFQTQPNTGSVFNVRMNRRRSAAKSAMRLPSQACRTVTKPDIETVYPVCVALI